MRNLPNYDIEIENATKNNLLQKCDIFEFKDTPMETLYSSYYTFCRENLDIKCKKGYDINPNIFIFSTCLSPNAKAGYDSKNYVIVVHIGLFKRLVENFYYNTTLDNYIHLKYANTIKEYDTPILKLITQLASQFTYYHELAHLIQFSKSKETMYLQEHYENTNLYSKEKHILEVNADKFAVVSIISHLQQYMGQVFKNELTQEKAEISILIFCTCLLNYILSFANNVDINRIYIRETFHPHPILRMLIVLATICQQIDTSSFFAQQGIKFKPDDIYRRVMDLYEELEQKNFFKTNLKEQINAFRQNDIYLYNEYMEEVQLFDLPNYYDALAKHNENLHK